MSAFNRRDWSTFAATLADDVTVLFDNEAAPERRDGRMAVEAILQPIFPPVGQASSQLPAPLRPADLLVLDLGDAVIISFHVRFPTLLARRTVVLRRLPAGWRVVHIHSRPRLCPFVGHALASNRQADHHPGSHFTEPSVSAPSHPYETRVDVLHGALELIDVRQLVAECTFPWYNQTLCRVNESVVRLGVVQGEYHWHKHDADDEFFYVVSGQFLIDLEDRTVTLDPQQGFVVPKGLMHRPRAPERTVILMVETAAIVPTSN